MDSDGRKLEKQVYFGSLKIILGNSVTVARLTLDQLVQVRILVPQVFLSVEFSDNRGYFGL
jgi:hypothetical protein